MSEKINYEKLLENVKEFVDKGKNEEYFLNLILIFDNSCSIQESISSSVYISEYAFNKNDYFLILKLGLKIAQIYINNIQDFDSDVQNCISFYFLFQNVIKVLDKDIQNLSNMLIKLYFYEIMKELFEMKKKEFKQSYYKEFKSSFNELCNKLKEELNNIKNNIYSILNNDSSDFEIELKNNLYKIVENLSNENKLTEINPNDLNENDEYYLISYDWGIKYYNFLNMLISIKDNLNDYKNFLLVGFDIKGIFSNFINIKKERSDISYIGPVNNFFVKNFVDFWEDEEEEYTNIFIKKNPNLYINIDINQWENIIKNFGDAPTIKRYKRNDELESFLREFKVIVLNKNIKEKYLSDIKVKYFQISKFDSYEDLLNKIYRCIKKKCPDIIFNKEDIKIYKSNDNSELYCFEILYSYFLNYKKFFLNCTEINQNDKIKNLIEEDSLIIIEIEKEKENNFIYPSYTNICSFCLEKNSNSEFKCDKISNCSFQYCSEKCINEDIEHINYHNNISNFFLKRTSLSELRKITINSLLSSNENSHGLIGLNNIGNTCYMNSALQCLSNCEDLTKLFLSKKYISEINTLNNLGSKGKISNAYYNLLCDLWKGNSKSISPLTFRNTFIIYNEQFSNYLQQDSNEFLIYFLDKLHEDLNRISKKPYIEMRNKEDFETDEIASLRWWKCYKKREDSIIIDFFHGQYKNKITCSECLNISISFDPFIFISLPIPSGRYNINVKYFYYMKNLEIQIENFNMKINENSTSNEFKNKILNEVNFIRSKNKNLNPLNYNDFDLILLDKNNQIIKIFKRNEYIFDYIYDGNSLVGYEKGKNENIYIYLTKFSVNYWFNFFAYQDIKFLFEYPIPIPINFPYEDNFRVSNLYELINKLIIKKIYNFGNNEKSFLLKYVTDINEEKENSFKFRFYIFNQYSNENEYCNFCGLNLYHFKKHTCRFAKRFNRNENIKYIISKCQKNLPLILYIDILSEDYNIQNILFSSPKKKKENNKTLLNKENDQIDIYDCLNLFRTEEKLEDENSWYCNKCKKHQEAFKKMDIYKSPQYLIIQLKRFKQSNQNLKKNSKILSNIYDNTGKNNSLINFPIKNLDLTNYILGSKKKEIYDLFAITNHFGDLSGGHYTAFCKNNGIWYEFDDSKVKRIKDEKKLISSSAYILFYKKRINT